MYEKTSHFNKYLYLTLCCNNQYTSDLTHFVKDINGAWSRFKMSLGVILFIYFCFGYTTRIQTFFSVLYYSSFPRINLLWHQFPFYKSFIYWQLNMDNQNQIRRSHHLLSRLAYFFVRHCCSVYLPDSLFFYFTRSSNTLAVPPVPHNHI